MKLQIFHADTAATPKHFVGIIHHDILYVDVVHLAKHLGRVNHRILHSQMVGIPQSRTSSYGKIAIVDSKSVYMPKRIVPFKTAVGCHDIAAFLDGRFTGKYGYIIQMQIVRSEQRAFASEFFVFNELHSHSLLIIKKRDNTSIFIYVTKLQRFFQFKCKQITEDVTSITERPHNISLLLHSRNILSNLRKFSQAKPFSP